MLHDVVQRKKFYTLVLQKCLTRSQFEYISEPKCANYQIASRCKSILIS